jgi:hypothetical protein
MKVSLTGYDLVFPLLAGTESAPGTFDTTKQILGTAFYLGSGFFITAGHVACVLQDQTRVPLLATPIPGESGPASASVIQEIEILDHDLAILRLNVRTNPQVVEPVIPWFTGEVSPFDDLWAIGFPYGLIPSGEFQQFQLRSFRGHAVGNPSGYELPSDNMRPASVYELSFQAPRGLSGGPLIAGLPNREAILAGIVVGNSSQSMIVHTGTETDASGQQKTIVERHESLHLGIAIQSSEALELNSDILGSTIGTHLSARDALRTML